MIEGAIEELSEEQLAEKAVSLKAIIWDDDFVPGLGPDPQAVINFQLDFDIYIGLLGTYFGTSTPRAGSGTEEEFDIASDRFRQDQTSCRVLFYFKKTADDIFNIDLEQFARVIIFKAKASESGLLYGEFSSQDELLRNIKKHLRLLLLNQWSGDAWKVLSSGTLVRPAESQAASRSSVEITPVVSRPEDTSPQERSDTELLDPPITADNEVPVYDDKEESDGILDLVVEVEDIAAIQKQVMSRMSVSAASFGTEIAKGTKDLGEAQRSGDTRAVRDAINYQASVLVRYAAELRTETPAYSASANDLLTTMQKVTRLYDEGGIEENDFRAAFTSFVELVDALKGHRTVFENFRKNLSAAPPVTKELNIAKRRLTNQLGTLSAALTLFSGRADEFIASVRQKLT